MNTENEVVKEFRQIKQEYAYDPDIMCQDDPRVARLKEIIDTKLSQVDKTIILLYCDCHKISFLILKTSLRMVMCDRFIFFPSFL